MGDQMTHTLINPYQIQVIGIPVNDDLTSLDQSLAYSMTM